MASELSFRATTTGSTIYGTIRNASRQMWNTSGAPAFESLTVANWTNYAIALTETPSASYFYVGSWPAGVSASGWYTLDIYKEASPGTAAISDTMVGTITAYWNGTTFEYVADDVVSVAGTAQTARDLGASVLISSGTGTGQLSVTAGVVAASGNWAVAGNQMDLVNAPNATALAAFVTKLMGTTGITAGGSATFAQILDKIYAGARGKIVQSGNAYAFYDDDNSTVLFTLTIGATSRTTA